MDSLEDDNILGLGSGENKIPDDVSNSFSES